MDLVTRRRFLTLAGIGALAGLAAACGAAMRSVQPNASVPPPAPSSTPTTRPSASATTPAAQPMSLEAKISQMLLVGFRGLTPDPGSRVMRDIADRGLGGVILFDFDTPTGTPMRNVESPAQLRALVDGLKAAAAERTPATPLLVAIDQEGGFVARLDPDHGFPATESAAALGSRNDPVHTEAAARAIADALVAAGINLNLAPVVDLDVNPDNPIIGAIERSFSADPAVVVSQAQAFIRGHRAVGVRTALKHFPGQGSATGDTHEGVVDVTGVWTAAELEPFSDLLGAAAADAVLTAHIFNATLDPTYPATLSSATVDGILRRRMGYDGVVISDDMQMGAILDAFGYDEALALAIGAGVDILTIANQQTFDVDVVERSIGIIAAHVASGRLTEDRIDASLARILTLKATLR